MPDLADLTVASGFATNKDGFVVPADLARERIVFTRADAKLLRRCVEGIFARHAMKFALRCDRQDCPDQKITQVEDGSRLIWRCGHADRVMETAF